MSGSSNGDKPAGSTGWQPSASLAALTKRAELLATTRGFFSRRGVLEVETPYLSLAANSDPSIESFAVGESEIGRRYLHTSPEFPMKRLLAAGSGDIYQLARVFRQAEQGAQHNPEFSMLEWYRLGFDDRQLAEEVASLLNLLLGLEKPYQCLSYRDAVLQWAGFDIDACSIEQCQQALGNAAVPLPEQDLNLAQWLDLVMGAVVSPQLGQQQLTCLCDYPADQAALARVVERDGKPVAARFEFYYQGVELANGYHELQSATELAERWQLEQQKRAQAGQVRNPLDQNLIQAQQNGLPDCAGVAVGFDRVLMLAMGEKHIAEVLAFDWSRA